MISNAKLKGHGAAVLCLDVSLPSSSASLSSSHYLLLSGSEDGTARLWDLREHKRHTCLCIKVPGGGDVLSCVFAPPPPSVAQSTTTATTRIPNEESVDNTATTFGRDCTVFLGVENTVLEYDLRKADTPIIISEPTQDWGQVLQNQDEVNQISLAYNNNISNTTSPKKKKNQKKKGGGGNKRRQQSGSGGVNFEIGPGSLYIAACDDAGKVSLCDYKNHDGNNTILHHDDDGVAVVTACAFRPVLHNNNNHSKRGGGGSGTAALEIASGGTDCKIHLWDISRKKPISTYTINQTNATDEEEKSKPQVCNPPFVYSLAWSNDGQALAAGLGDGTVGVFEVNNRALVQSKLLIGNEGIDGTMYYAHESSVASVVYPFFSAPTNDRILCSAGSDGSIVFWDLGKSSDEQWDDFETTGSAKYNETQMDSDDVVVMMFPPALLQGLRNGNDEGIYHNQSAMSLKPKILFDIAHGEKINWVTAATPSGNTPSQANDTIFVADTSQDITSYTIPFS